LIKISLRKELRACALTKRIFQNPNSPSLEKNSKSKSHKQVDVGNDHLMPDIWWCV